MVRFNIECTIAFPREQFWRLRDSDTFSKFVVDDGLLKTFSVTDPVADDDGSMTRQQFYSPVEVDCPDFIRHVCGDTMFNVSDVQRWNDAERPYHLSFEIRPTFLTDLSSTSGELKLEPYSMKKQRQAQQQLKQQQHNNKDTTGKEKEKDSDSSSVDSISTTSSSSITTDDDEDEEDEEDEEDDEEDDKDCTQNIVGLDPEQKSLHTINGHVRVRILTLGWFVERAVAHNLRMFYKEYEHTVYRFRCKLYRQFANNDPSVPIATVVDRLLQHDHERRAHSDKLAAAVASLSTSDRTVDSAEVSQSKLLPSSTVTSGASSPSTSSASQQALETVS